jgi:hypothetical protein
LVLNESFSKHEVSHIGHRGEVKLNQEYGDQYVEREAKSPEIRDANQGTEDVTY